VYALAHGYSQMLAPVDRLTPLYDTAYGQLRAPVTASANMSILQFHFSASGLPALQALLDTLQADLSSSASIGLACGTGVESRVALTIAECVALTPAAGDSGPTLTLAECTGVDGGDIPGMQPSLAVSA